ncbi:MAG TPA: peptide chain release factor 2 [Gammaproteobacteria bacterium]|nr:peptide chain release factor 2 [Gammaproteobacteria bacterium]
MDETQIKLAIDELKERFNALRGYLDFDKKSERLNEILETLNDPDIWENRELTRNLNQERARLEKTLSTLETFSSNLEDASILLELAISEDDQKTLNDLTNDVKAFDAEISQLEIQRMFRHEMDTSNSFLDVQAGSGGTEAQDWANMLLRMYMKWCESNNFSAELIEISPGEVAGIKSATIHVAGEFAYGWLRTETGVHRLVRKSPFDSGNRRHTSFAAVFVSPEIEDDFDVEIDPSDLRIDVYRASGAGGQHVNTTESAVRITHLPTGTVVQCQNDRSQHKNKATAMKQIRARLFELEKQKRQEQAQALEETKADIGWGSQIRSYVLDQSRVKDLRTQIESSNPEAILNGDINKFLEASLKQGL